MPVTDPRSTRHADIHLSSLCPDYSRTLNADSRYATRPSDANLSEGQLTNHDAMLVTDPRSTRLADVHLSSQHLDDSRMLNADSRYAGRPSHTNLSEGQLTNRDAVPVTDRRSTTRAAFISPLSTLMIPER